MSLSHLVDYLGHMLEAARLARTYVEGMSKEDFLDDKRTQQAIILNIVVIGEAATKLSKEYPEFISQHSDVPWRNIKGMRNRIAHGYFDINLDVVWDTVREALPQFIEQLSGILDSLSNGGNPSRKP